MLTSSALPSNYVESQKVKLTPIPNECLSLISVKKETMIVQEKEVIYFDTDHRNLEVKGEWMPVTYRVYNDPLKWHRQDLVVNVTTFVTN